MFCSRISGLIAIGMVMAFWYTFCVDTPAKLVTNGHPFFESFYMELNLHKKKMPRKLFFVTRVKIILIL